MQMLATNGIGPGRIGVPAKTSVFGLGGGDGNGQPGVGVGIDALHWRAAGPGTTTTPASPGSVSVQGPSSPTALPATVANLYVRKTGLDANGGSSASVTPDQTGTDGVTNGTTTFTSASAVFSASDVNKLINIVTKARYRIVGFTNANTVTLSGSPTAGSGLTWNLGGAVLTAGALLTITNTPAGSVLGGDRIWIGAGTYRETNIIGITPTFEVQVVGDVDGAMTGDAGMVQLTAYTTNDRTAPAALAVLNLNAKSNLTFLNLFLVGGNATDVVTAGTGSQNVIFRNCAMLAGHNGAHGTVSITSVSQTPMFFTFDRCLFVAARGAGNNFNITGTRAPVDYDMQVVISNSFMTNPGIGMAYQGGGSGAGFGGGVKMRACTFLQSTLFYSNVSTSIPNAITNCFLYCGSNTAINAAVFNQSPEDYNLIVASTPRAATPIGAHSISDGSYSPIFHFGQEVQWGGLLRQFGMPMVSSPLIGFGVPADGFDFAGGPRPAGGSTRPSVGMLERNNTVAQALSPVPPSGTHVWQQTGPGYQDFLVPVTTSATTIAVSAQRNSAYTGPMPTLELLPNAQVGVLAQVVPMAGPDSAWETVTLKAFTPSAAGVVTVRIRSQDTLGTALVSFANFTIT